MEAKSLVVPETIRLGGFKLKTKFFVYFIRPRMLFCTSEEAGCTV